MMKTRRSSIWITTAALAVLGGIIFPFSSASASLIPIDVVFGDVLVSGQSETGIGDPYCPPGISCDFRPGARVFRTTVAIAQRVQTPNPLEINLIDNFFSVDDLIDDETLAFWIEREQQSRERIKTIRTLLKKRQRELRIKRRPPSARIVATDNDKDPFLLTLEYDPDEFIPPYLVLNVVDSVTGEFSDTRIKLVPEPTTVALLGLSLVGLVGLGIARKKKRDKNKKENTEKKSA